MNYAAIRSELAERVKQQYAPAVKAVLFLSNNEYEHSAFRQNSNFYYLTGLNDPGMALILDLEKNRSILYYLRYTVARDTWILSHNNYQTIDSNVLGFDAIVPLGEPATGYQSSVLIEKKEYELLLNDLRGFCLSGGKIGVAQEKTDVHQHIMMEQLKCFSSELAASFVDISNIINQMRRIKRAEEIALLEQAEIITIAAHRTAASMIKPGRTEKEIQVLVEGMISVAGAELSFPSIIGSGICSTVLHYTQNNRVMEKDDLVVIDMGACYNHYCADLTRTYPVSGRFSTRQKEIYTIVLDVQTYIASLAKPGVWLNYKKEPSLSLNHQAHAYIKKYGYDRYFPHGVGHYLGLDTHDVGDYSVPLQVGDIITIEPGIYIPHERLGVRIEDNYLITDSGNRCLSQSLEKDVSAIEELMARLVEKNYSISDYLEHARRFISY